MLGETVQSTLNKAQGSVRGWKANQITQTLHLLLTPAPPRRGSSSKRVRSTLPETEAEQLQAPITSSGTQGVLCPNPEEQVV